MINDIYIDNTFSSTGIRLCSLENAVVISRVKLCNNSDIVNTFPSTVLIAALDFHRFVSIFIKLYNSLLPRSPSGLISNSGSITNVDDMAAASVFVMELDKNSYDKHTEPMQSHINVGFGSDVTIAELAKAVSDTVGYKGKIIFDSSKPDGSPRKWMDSGRLTTLGWMARIELGDGLENAYYDFQKNHSKE